MGRRSYGQLCAVARALDLVGERWTLLLVRELLFGPRRFGELLEALAGIGPNLLSARLKALAEEGLVRRVALRGDPRGGPTGYELTDEGRALEGVLLELARWELNRPTAVGTGNGAGAGVGGTPNSQGAVLESGQGAGLEEVRPSWAIFALQARFDPASSSNVSEVYTVESGERSFTLGVRNGHLELSGARDPAAVLTLRAQPRALAGLALGEVTLERAAELGLVEVQGSPFAVTRFARVFRLEGAEGA